MSDLMSLNIDNFGPINKAKLNINKINVIVGENSTGKSTSSKLLFCILTAASKEGEHLANVDIKSRLINFLKYWTYKLLAEPNAEFHINKINDILITPLEKNELSTSLFEETHRKIREIFDNINFKGKEIFYEDLDELYDIILLNKDNNKKYAKVLDTLIQSEYGAPLDNYIDSKVTFYGNYDDKSFEQDIILNGRKSLCDISNEYLNYFDFKNIIYIDSQSIFEIDTQNQYNTPYHLKLLERKLKKVKNNTDVYNSMHYKDSLLFETKIRELIRGKFEYLLNENHFIFKKNNKTYSMESTASGLKQLGIIQLLLDNTELTKNSFLILDEPEINLHPNFQVKFAEILVLAVKELNLTLYINTYSPFFTEAIEAYSLHYNLEEDTNFYLTEPANDNDKYDYTLMNGIDILEIYDNLGNPFDTIQKIKLESKLKKDLERQ